MVVYTPDRYMKQVCTSCGAVYVSHQPSDVLMPKVIRCKKCGHSGFEYVFFTRPWSSGAGWVRRFFAFGLGRRL